MSIENIFLSLSIETDGIIVTSNRDPPGQKSVYIAPGNVPCFQKSITIH